jgi:hypothetical protein
MVPLTVKLFDNNEERVPKEVNEELTTEEPKDVAVKTSAPSIL